MHETEKTVRPFRTILSSNAISPFMEKDPTVGVETMALITDASTAWSAPIVLNADEIWQVRTGSVYLTTTAAPDIEDGLFLHEMHAVHFSVGSTVLYRQNGDVDCIIVREAV